MHDEGHNALSELATATCVDLFLHRKIMKKLSFPDVVLIRGEKMQSIEEMIQILKQEATSREVELNSTQWQ